jgi:hypothetical protein
MNRDVKLFTARMPGAQGKKAEGRNSMPTQGMISGFVQWRFLSNVLLGVLAVKRVFP